MVSLGDLMKAILEVVLYTVFALAGIFAINTAYFNTVINSYVVYIILLFIIPIYLLRHSGRSVLASFGLKKNLMLYIYISLLFIICASSILVYNPSKYQIALFSFILVPVAEETAFRGYMVTMLKGLGSTSAFLFSGIAFGLAHLAVDNSFQSIILRLVIGILFAYIFFVSGKLLITISLHVLFNVYTILHSIISIQSYISITAALLLALTALYDYYRERRNAT